jgi:flagellin
MISINTNYGGLQAAKAAQDSQRIIDDAMTKLSTGKRINASKDDSAGQAIAMRLEGEVRGLAIASRNASDGQALIDTAEGALRETHNVLIRMRELAVQAQNGTLQTSDKSALGVEFDALEAEITRISDNTTWGGIKILDGSYQGTTTNPSLNAISFRVGSSENITHTILNMAATAALGFSTTHTVAQASTIAVVDAAIAKVSEERAKLGAVSNRLDSTVTNLDQIRVNLAASKGRIEDADFAQETGNLAKGQILQQAATAMVAQANASKSTVLTLLRG